MSDKHRMTTFYDEQTVLDFARAAADHFASHPGHAVVGTDAFGPSPGEFLALRWGSHDRAVLVLRVGEDFQPVTFMWVRRHRNEPCPDVDDLPRHRLAFTADDEDDPCNPGRPQPADGTPR